MVVTGAAPKRGITRALSRGRIRRTSEEVDTLMRARQDGWVRWWPVEGNI